MAQRPRRHLHEEQDETDRKAAIHPAVLVVESEPLASGILQRQNAVVETHHPREVTTRSCSGISRKIKESQYELLWLELPSNDSGFLQKRRGLSMAAFATWLRQAQANKIPAILIGLRGRHWEDEHLAKLLHDKVATEHTIALCKLGIRVLPESTCASSVRFNALQVDISSTPPTDLAGPRCCGCGQVFSNLNPQEQSLITSCAGCACMLCSDFCAHDWRENRPWCRCCVQRRPLLNVANLTCACAADAPHMYELGSPLKGRGYLKAAAAKKVFTHILKPYSNFSGQKVRPKPPKAKSDFNNVALAVTQDAFPTDAKEKEKEWRKDWKLKYGEKRKAKKIQKPVEDHWDDLGDDLSGLGTDVEFFQAPVICEVCADSESEMSDEELTHGLVYWALSGPGGNRNATHRTTLQVPDLVAVLAMLARVGPGIDLVEFCGGEGRASKIAIRRRLRAGRNFDIVTQADLGDPTTQEMALKYLDDNHVLVVAMGPSCRTLGPPSNLNMVINYETWKRHSDEDQPHVSFCGHAALTQMRRLRHFFLEHIS